MEEKGIFATAEDIVSAAELIYENEKPNILSYKVFNIWNIISLVNFGCIKNTDKVLITCSEVDTIIWTVSYIYKPQKLISNKINQAEKNNNVELLYNEKWENISGLLTGCSHRQPIFSNENIDNIGYKNERFNVFVAGFINTNEKMIEIPISRFYIKIGIEYEMFEKFLIKSKDLLEEEGVLLILATPAWVLKAWTLIHEFGLQLEYENYRLYTDNHRNANVFIWLKFIKKEKDFNVNLQKRNVLSLMKDNGIDRLFAHRNNLRFPYVELSYNNSESYIKLNQNLEYMQYFFSNETTLNLAELCEGYTACLVTPSIAQYAYKINKNVVLFERDNRFRENKGLKFVKYDLNTGLTKFIQNKYRKKFDRVICDPPFNINLNTLAKDIAELLKESDNSVVYIIFPDSRKISLVNAMKAEHLLLSKENISINIEYAKPPKIVRIYGKQAIQLYKFTYNKQ